MAPARPLHVAPKEQLRDPQWGDKDHIWETLTYKQELQTSGISSKAINKTLLHKPDS